MDKKINFIILNINAYASYDGRDMAGAMRIKNLFNPLIENGEVTVSNLIMLDLFGIQHNGHNQSTEPAVECLSIGYRSVKHPLSVLRFLKKGMNFIKTHRRKNADNIIYNYQYPDIRNFLLLLYAKYKGFKIVFDIVEDKKHEVVATWNDKMRMKFSLSFLKLIPSYADGVFVISAHLMKEITEITGGRIPVFMLPISVNFKNTDGHNLVKENNGIVKIFYGGSFAKKDGLEYLLDAINELDEKKHPFKLILSGKGNLGEMERLFSKIKNKNLLEYVGFLSIDEYFNLLKTVDICCMTRNNSAFANAGFPFKLGEFLAAGKVIIASRIGDVEKYLRHKESAYLVKPESTTEIVAGLNYCIDNLAILSRTMGPKARLVAEAHFDSRVSSRYMLEKCSGFFVKDKKSSNRS